MDMEIDQRIFYLVPDGSGEPNPKQVLENGFMTEDGRFPYYIRDEEGARAHYRKMVTKTELVPMRLGKLLSEEDFINIVSRGEPFDLATRNDVNDDGRILIWDGELPGAVEFYKQATGDGLEFRTLPEILDEDDFAKMAIDGETISLRGVHFDKTPKMIRGTIIGYSDGGGIRLPSLSNEFFYGPRWRRGEG